MVMHDLCKFTIGHVFGILVSVHVYSSYVICARPYLFY